MERWRAGMVTLRGILDGEGSEDVSACRRIGVSASASPGRESLSLPIGAYTPTQPGRRTDISTIFGRTIRQVFVRKNDSLDSGTILHGSA